MEREVVGVGGEKPNESAKRGDSSENHPAENVVDFLSRCRGSTEVASST